MKLEMMSWKMELENEDGKSPQKWKSRKIWCFNVYIL